ncbi:MAG: dTDP-4-dehydrorhamnose reductase [Alistipes sp.]
MLNILITGANGQLGREMRLLGATSANRYLFTDVAELDITDVQAVRTFIDTHRINVIVNCAAYTNVEKAEEEPQTADLLNNKAAANLAIAAKEADATLIHISTDYVFQGDGNLPYGEDAPTNPLGVYGSTKLAGEESIKLTGCKYLLFRTAWLYSAFGNNFVKTMLQLTAEKEQLKVIFDQVGTPTYAGDLAQIIFGIIEKEQYADHEGIYHFTNEGVCSWYDFAHEVAVLSGHTHCKIQPCHTSEFPSNVRRPAFSVLDKSKVKATFGIEIPYWRDALLRCIEKIKK